MEKLGKLLAQWLVKGGLVLLVLNEIRGLVLAAPVIYAMWHSGGSLMSLWLGFCTLAGIALSVFLPMLAARKLKLI
jgi:hypothetical protein